MLCCMQSRKIGTAIGGLFLATFGWAAPLTAPAHPTVLMAEHDGKPQAVVAVEKEEPCIIAGGRRLRLRGNIPLTTERVERYAAGTATLDAMRVEGLQLISAASELDVDKFTPGATIGGYVEFSATITTTSDLADCYVALVVFESAFLKDDTHPPKAQIRVRQLPDLLAGRPTPVKFSTSPFLGREKTSAFVLLFSAGREVRTNVSSLGDQYFYRRERVIHAAAVRHWLEQNPGASRPAQPLLLMPPQFASTEGFPADATADLTITPDGTVLHVSLDRTFTPSTEENILRTLGAWLFLPKITGGAPVLTHVLVPLRF